MRNSFSKNLGSDVIPYENEKWTVDTASDFMQKWYKYEKNIGV